MASPVNISKLGQLMKAIPESPEKRLLQYMAEILTEESTREDMTKRRFAPRGPRGPAGTVGGLTKKYFVTSEGGYAIKLTNRTGAASVKGTIVSCSDTYDNAFIPQAVEFDAIGAVYENGRADGEECFVVFSGIAEVLLKDATSAIRGYWVQAADTDGRAEVTTPPSGIGALVAGTHFKEIGHCLESKDAGTNVLAKIILHFN